MSAVLLIVIICVSYLIVRVGAIALEMTGMERSMARFQALSAFSGTGFTTRDSELVVHHPRRRQIITYLIVLGNAGIVSVIATFVLSFRDTGIFNPSIKFLVVSAILFGFFRIVSHRRYAVKLTEKIRTVLREKAHFEKVYIEEILRQADGYGVASIIIAPESRLVETTIRESGLREKNILVFSIERSDGVIPVPRANSKIRAGDRLLCFGELAQIEGLV